MITAKTFKQFLDSLKKDKSINLINALSNPAIQESLNQIEWSAYRYAELLIICNPRSITAADKALSQLPGFQKVSKVMRQTAMIDIIEARQGKGITLHVAATNAFINTQPRNEPNCTTDPDTVFTHGDDFEDFEGLVYTLQVIPLERWNKLLSLPGIDQLILKLYYHTVVDFNEVFDELFWMSSEKLKIFFAQPNMLEMILRGFFNMPLNWIKFFLKNGHATCWYVVANDQGFEGELTNAIIERIAQNRGDTLLDLLGECPEGIYIETAQKVYDIVKKGYELQDNAQGLSSAQCKQWQFFSPQKPYPFLEKLEKKIELMKNQDLSPMRLK
jgi:hypothetical protein